MDHAPTEEEKTAVYRYCTTSRDLMLNKKRFSDKKKTIEYKNERSSQYVVAEYGRKGASLL